MTKGLEAFLNLPRQADQAGDLPEMADALKASGHYDGEAVTPPASPDAASPDAASPYTAGMPGGSVRGAATGSADDAEATLDAGLARIMAMSHAAERRLDMIEGGDHAKAMDELYQETHKHAQDIMDLGFNIDPARSARLFEVAAGMYGRAIEAKTAKRESQLKAMKLAVEQKRLELEEKRLNHLIGDQPAAIIGTANVVVEDRNELIRRMRAQLPKKD